MAASDKTLMQVNIVAADRPVWTGQARSAMVPATAGSMGIMPDHEPLLTLLQKGRITVVTQDGSQRTFNVDSGFASFDSNRLTVAVDHKLADDKRSDEDTDGD
ncbi:F0F1 ATP synthase subunit epsilon [Bifidobacterium favimelis]|uniref:F0F1 ATP synthase subunit epsilon n=1 Tax=Bifidobacterium favimelis TaxID=3122979 RepID=A0ABU8ZM12_9BIFI